MAQLLKLGMTIADFLDARISEDEALIADSPKNGDYYDVDRPFLNSAVIARLRSECSAKRAILVSYGSCAAVEEKVDADMELGRKLVSAGMTQGLEIALKMLAAVHSGHPDYLPEWKL